MIKKKAVKDFISPIPKGRMVYVPDSLIDLANDIQKKRGYEHRSKALRDLEKHARVGIEAEKIYKLSFGDILKGR